MEGGIEDVMSGSVPGRADPRVAGLPLLRDGMGNGVSAGVAENKGVEGASRDEIALNLFTIVCFPLGLPFAFSGTGWVLGPFFLAYSALVTFLNSTLLGTIVLRRPALTSYAGIAEAAFGWAGGMVAFCIQILGVYLTTVYFIVMLGEYSSILFARSGLCQQDWLLVLCVLLAGLAQIPTWKALAGLAAVFLVVTTMSVAVLVYECMTGYYCHRSYLDFGFTSSVNSLSSFCFAFAGSAIFPEVMQEMTRKQDFLGGSGSLAMAYYAIVPLYAVAGGFGFWAFGSDSSGNIMENWRTGSVRAVALGANLFMYSMGVLEYNQLLSKKLEAALLGPFPCAVSAIWPYRRKRALLRFCLVGSECFMAEMLFSAGIGNIMALAGALGLLLTYVFPHLFFLCLFPSEHLLPLPWPVVSTRLLSVNALISAVLALLGAVVACQSLANESTDYSLFDGDCVARVDGDHGRERCSVGGGG